MASLGIDDQEAARHGIARSSHWPAVERAHRARHPHCMACGPALAPPIQVHHIFPFHYCVALGRPDLELDDRNLVSLCEAEKDRPAEDHHLLIGHADSFRSSNLTADVDAAGRWAGKSAAEIRADLQWQQLVAGRLKPLGDLSADERIAFRVEMDRRFPKL